MADVTVTTNNQERELICYEELTEKERKDFDYLDTDEHLSPRFFRYKGSIYDTSDCEVSASPSPWLAKWSGYFSETFFSGVVFRYVYPDMETVVVGRYYA